MNKDYPFKFLDSYEKEDLEIFFGRDREVAALYDLVFKTKLVLLYGPSGVGKTSIIRCGLSNKFDDTHWLSLYIRKKDNLLKSIHQSVKKEIHKIEKDAKVSENLIDSLELLYLTYFKPVYLIFDQFEEIFIFGKPEEVNEFFQFVKSLLASKLNVKIILSMREEYIAYLTDYEKIVPRLFESRIRIEKMHQKELEVVIGNTTEAANIKLTPKKEVIETIIRNLKDKREGVELSYLQVYLDRLYKEAQKTNSTKIVFNEKLLSSVGQIEDVLGKFLDDQLLAINKEIKREKEETAQRILFEFVTDAGTKKPLSKTELERIAEKFGLVPEQLDTCLRMFKELRILREEDL